MPRQYNTNQRWQVSTSAVCLSIQANDAWTFCWCLPGSKNHRVGKLIQLLHFHIHVILPSRIIPQGTEKLCPFPLLGHPSGARSSVTAVYTLGAAAFTSSPGCTSGLPPSGSLYISTCPLPVNSPHSSWSHLSRMQTWSCHFPPCWPVTSRAFHCP